MAYVFAPRSAAESAHASAPRRAAESAHASAPPTSSSPRRREVLLSRFFFPQGPAVLEDPATGSATANLGGWYIAMDRERPVRIEIAQGEQTGRPSILYLDVEADRRVRVSGDVIELGRGTVSL